MKISDKKIVFNGIVFDIEQMNVEFSFGNHAYQIIRHPGGAAVLPVHEDGTVTMICQFRPAAGSKLLEIPAGRLEAHEEPMNCAIRELKEETGITSGNIVSLGKIHSSPGVFDEVIHLFAATEITQGDATPEDYEDIETVRLPFAEALAMAADGRISDAKTVIALFRWQAMSINRKP